jgi:hypothetical protein
MANTYTGTFTVSFSVSQVNSTGLILPETVSVTLAYPAVPLQSVTYQTTGTAAGEINLITSIAITLTASTPQTFNLTSSFTDLFGGSCNYARVREFWLANPSATAGYNTTLYAAASNGWSMLPPSTAPLTCFANGGTIRLSDPQSTGAGNGQVTSGSSCEFTLNPGSNGQTVYLLLCGGTAA